MSECKPSVLVGMIRGGKAVVGTVVTVHFTERDVAVDTALLDCGPHHYKRTDHRGLTTINLREETHTLEIYTRESSQSLFFDSISVGSGEARREVFTIP